MLMVEALAIAALCIRNRPTGDSFGAVMEQAMKLVCVCGIVLLRNRLNFQGTYDISHYVRCPTFPFAEEHWSTLCAEVCEDVGTNLKFLSGVHS